MRIPFSLHPLQREGLTYKSLSRLLHEKLTSQEVRVVWSLQSGPRTHTGKGLEVSFAERNTRMAVSNLSTILKSK